MLTTTLALVEDDPDTRARFTRVIAGSPGLSLLHASATGGDLLHWFARNPVDVLLVDLGLPDMPGIQVIHACARLRPDCAIMVVSIFGDEKNMLAAFEAGACGYLLKDGTEADLAGHVRSLQDGGSPLSPLIARKLLQRLHPARIQQQPEQADRLSARESQILDLVARGFTYGEIADQISVSLNTVHTHIRNIYGKLGVHNKTEAIFEARQIGLLR